MTEPRVENSKKRRREVLDQNLVKLPDDQNLVKLSESMALGFAASYQTLKQQQLQLEISLCQMRHCIEVLDMTFGNVYQQVQTKQVADKLSDLADIKKIENEILNLSSEEVAQWLED